MTQRHTPPGPDDPGRIAKLARSQLKSLLMDMRNTVNGTPTVTEQDVDSIIESMVIMMMATIRGQLQ